MELKDLKYIIEADKFQAGLYIFKYSENDFLPVQYVKEVAHRKKLDISYIDSLAPYLITVNDLFGDNTENSSHTLCLYRCEEFNCAETLNLSNSDILIIITQKVSKDAQSKYNENIVEFPKLLEWQIQDYVYSMLPKVNKNKLDWMIKVCGGDIYRLQCEIDKLKLFNEAVHPEMFDTFISDNVFSDLSEYNVFNLTNCIVNKDLNTLARVYQKLDNIDVSEFGLITLLYNNFRNIISIQLAPNPTPESTGLKPNQFNAIRYNCGKYSKKQLIDIFEFLTSLDKRIKTGEIDTKILIDYIIVKILSM